MAGTRGFWIIIGIMVLTLFYLIGLGVVSAQEPDPAQMLGRRAGIMNSADQDRMACLGWGFRGRAINSCMNFLAYERMRVIPAGPAGPGLTLCDTVRIDSDYSTTDCF